MAASCGCRASEPRGSTEYSIHIDGLSLSSCCLAWTLLPYSASSASTPRFRAAAVLADAPLVPLDSTARPHQVPGTHSRHVFAYTSVTRPTSDPMKSFMLLSAKNSALHTTNTQRALHDPRKHMASLPATPSACLPREAVTASAMQTAASTPQISRERETLYAEQTPTLTPCRAANIRRLHVIIAAGPPCCTASS